MNGAEIWKLVDDFKVQGCNFSLRVILQLLAANDI